MKVKNQTGRIADAKFDILKLFLSVCVVAIHSGLYPQVLYPWLRIAVPLFFMISAYFLFSKLDKVAESEHWKILKNYVFRNLKLYCFWFIVLLPFTLYIRRTEYFGKGFWKGIHVFLRGLLFDSTFSASWFITASAMGTILIYCIFRKFKKGGTFAVALAGFVFATLWSSYRQYFVGNDLILKLARCYRDIFSGPVCSFPVALIWIFIGKLFAEGKLRLKHRWLEVILLVLSCTGLWLEWNFVRRSTGSMNNDCYFMLLPTAILLFGLILKIKPFAHEHSAYFRRASTVVYTTHTTLVYAIDFVSRRLLHMTSPLWLFCTALTGSLLIYGCIEMYVHRFPGNKLSKLLKNAY